MSGHTPGPWRLSPTGARVIADRPGGNGTRGTIATMHRQDFYAARADNARLVAAAPALLAACKFALSQMEAAGLLCGDVRNAVALAEQEPAHA